MSPAQVSLLQRCIAADRRYRSRLAAGKLASPDERGVEVGLINGVSVKTADALVNAGLIELVCLTGGHAYAFLGSYAPQDELAPEDDY